MNLPQKTFVFMPLLRSYTKIYHFISSLHSDWYRFLKTKKKKKKKKKTMNDDGWCFSPLDIIKVT